MVRYLDPEEHPEGLEDERREARQQRASHTRRSPAEKLAKLRERNAALTGVDAIEAAREVALRQLDTRSRSRHELRTTLLSRGFTEEVSEHVLDRLENVGLIDDAAYAAMIVRDRFTLRGAVGRAIVEELTRKGIPAHTIAAAMDHIDADAEYERAHELATRKAQACQGLPRQKAWNRLSGMLARKGYPPSICARVLSEVLDGWGHSASNDEGEFYDC